MSLGIVVKSLVIWLAILVLAVANGALREFVLLPALGQVPAYLLSGVLLAFLILCVAYITLPWLSPQNQNQLVMIGLLWLGLTLVFEFTFGLLQGKPLTQLLNAYTFKDGNLWPLVLLVTTFAPWLASKLRTSTKK